VRVLVVGAAGMLGTDVVAEFTAGEHEVQAVDMADLDITDPQSVAAIPEGRFGKLDWCINCAAYTAVDRAEVEVDAATMVNALGPGFLARACAMANVRMIHISTDFVFDGKASEPYTEEQPANPLGVYARSKREGEEAVLASGANALIVRTAWLYGPNGNCFPKTMVNAWKTGKNLRVVADQIGTPTYTLDLAKTLVQLAEKDPVPAIYHAAGPDVMSWHEFAKVTLETYKHLNGLEQPIEIEPIRTEDWPTPATRPKYSALSTGRLQSLGIGPMRPTAEALGDFCRRLSI
jgi:dTDP-4-dehydrorhamnose reductase